MSDKIQVLICENGNHEWTRPAKKGKKPRFCLEHAPVVVAKTDTVTLTCAAGHTWERPRIKGKKPLYCPDHKPEAATKTPKMEVLKCAHDGHEWTRPKRGKSPRFCPDHKPEKVTANTRVGSSGVPNADIDNPLVSAILDGQPSELQRKLRYVVNEFRNPRPTRDLGDWTNLHETFKALLREAARVMKVTPTTPVEAA